MRASGGFLTRRTAVFGVLAGAYFLSQFYRSTNAVIAKDLSSELHLTAAHLGLMTSLFYASFAAVQLPLGAALDRFGARFVTPALMLLTALGSVLFGTAHGFAQLALGRALIGAGLAGVYMGSLKVFSRWFSLRRFASASGLLVGLGALGALSAGTPLAWLNATLGWRDVFLAASLVVLLACVLIVVWVRDAPPGVDRRTDGGGRGRVTDVFREVRFWRIALLDFFLVGTLLSMQGLWGGPLLYDTLGLSQLQVGDALLSLSAGALVGYLSSGWLAERFGGARVLVATSSVFLAAQGLIMVGAWVGQGVMVRAAFPLFGVSGACNILLMAHARTVFPTSMTGRVVTAVNVFGIGGSALLQWSMGMIVNAFGQDALGHYPPRAYVAALALTFTGGLLALAFYAPLARGRSGFGLEGGMEPPA